MKIIKKGNLKKPWWLGKKVQCRDCKCTFVLEKGDNVKKVPVADERGFYWPEHAVCCPECKKKTTFLPDTQNPEEMKRYKKSE